MTFQLLNDLIKENNIPENVKLMSDSGWECGATNMNGVWYCKRFNTIVFTQNGSEYDYDYVNDNDWKLIYGQGLDNKD